MQAIYPPKLQKGDNLRVVAPARSMALLSEETVRLAKERIESMGFRVSFGKNVMEKDCFMTSSVASRVEDLNDAFLDPNVRGILSVIGGYSANQLLGHLDYGLIRKNPKILCGFSDITALSNAIFAQTGVVGYSGPHFSSWGMRHGFEYAMEHFEKCCVASGPFSVKPSDRWSDDAWYIDQEARNFEPNEGYWTLQGGVAEGRLLGGHIFTLMSSAGTQYFPQLHELAVLFIETNDEFQPQVFEKNLQSLIQQPGFGNVKGLVIGRFQKKSGMTKALLEKIVSSKTELAGIPIVANADFGHTTPFVTFPVGGKVRVVADGGSQEITVLEH